jgi:tetratricopeptide (TPR) repeat protein
MIREKSTHVEYAEAFWDLGLNKEALDAIKLALATEADSETLVLGIKIFMINQRFAEAAGLAERLMRRPNLCTFEFMHSALAYHFAGQSERAYQIECRALDDAPPMALRGLFYGLACRASVTGRLEEGLGYIMKSFLNSSNANSYMYRRVFVDSELADIWEYAETAKPSLAYALSLSRIPFDGIAKCNLAPEPVCRLDHAEMKILPAEFFELFRPSDEVLFEVDPYTRLARAGLYERFVGWQHALASRRVESFKKFGHRVTHLLEDAQAEFLRFQVAKNRLGAARYHLLYMLKQTPDCDPARLPHFKSLEPLTTEFQAQFQESPQAFACLVRREYIQDPQAFVEEGFEALPAFNRHSGLGSIALGNCFYKLGCTAEALRPWALCARRWPWDESPLLNLLQGLLGLGRTEEAEGLFEEIPRVNLPAKVQEELRQCIVQKKSQHPIRRQPDIPTPAFDGLFEGADEEFLRWRRQRRFKNKAAGSVSASPNKPQPQTR